MAESNEYKKDKENENINTNINMQLLDDNVNDKFEKKLNITEPHLLHLQKLNEKYKLETELENCKKKLEKTKTNLTDCKKMLKITETEFTDCKKKLERTETELVYCKKELEKSETENKTLKEKLDKKNEQPQQNYCSIQNVGGNYSGHFNPVNNNEMLENKISTLEKELQVTTNNISILEKKLNDANSKIINLQKNIQEEKDKNNKLNALVEKLTNELTTLKENENLSLPISESI